MGKGPKSVKVLCQELGFVADSAAEKAFRKDCIEYLKGRCDDLCNTPDDAIEPVAWDFLDDGYGGGAHHFSASSAAFVSGQQLRYRWDVAQDRLTLWEYVGSIMKMQRWYKIDALHHQIRGVHNCPGCLVHARPAPAAEIAATTNGRRDESLLHWDSDGRPRSFILPSTFIRVQMPLCRYTTTSTVTSFPQSAPNLSSSILS